MEPAYNISSDEDDGPGPSKKLKPDATKSDVQNKPPSLSALPGNKCVYIDCGKTRRDDPTLKKYKFPRNEALQQQWVINSGNLSLSSLSPDVLHRKTVCSEHFDDSHFVNPRIKSRFVKGAVPKPYNSDLTPFQPIMQVKILENLLSSSVNSVYEPGVSSDKGAENKGFQALDEPEIKVETMVDKTSDPLQLSDDSHYKQHTGHTLSLKTVTQSSPVPKNNPTQMRSVPIILRKVSKPPEAVLNEVRRYNTKTIKISDVAKFTPSIQAVKVPLPSVSAKVKSVDQINTPEQTTHTKEPIQTIIVEDVDSENVVERSNDDKTKNKKEDREHDKEILQNEGPGSDSNDRSLSDTAGDTEATFQCAVGIEDISTECCTFLGCRMNKDNSYIKFYKFPTDYESVKKWLDACDRVDILFQSQKDIEKYAATSIGVCFQHKNAVEKRIIKNEHIEKAKIGKNQFNKVDERKITEQNPQDTNKEVTTTNQTKETAKSGNRIPYFPHKEYCAFINCSTFIRDQIKKYRFPADQELLTQWLEAAGIPIKLLETTLRTLFICAKHFKPDQYTEMGTLILSSVPTPHTEFVDSSSHEGNAYWANKELMTKNDGKCMLMLPKPSTGPSSTVVSSTLSRTATNVVHKQRPKASTSTNTDQTVRRAILESACAVKHCLSNRLSNYMYSFPRNSSKFVDWVRAVEGSNFIMNTDLVTSYQTKLICDKHFEKRYQIGHTMLTEDALPSLHLGKVVPKTENDIVTEKDTSIFWTQRNSDVMETNFVKSRAPPIKGNAILWENGIEFPNIKRQLKFGKDCPKVGYLKRFPYKVYRMTKKSKHGRETEAINPGHKIQIHTAIIVDDDDQAEKEAIRVISKIIMENSNSLPPLRRNKKNIVVTNNKNTE